MPTTNRARVLRFQAQMAEMAERVGARMRQRREELRLTQAELALRIEGKTTGDQVSRWERGKHQPNDLGPIARALEVDVAYFYVPPAAANGNNDNGDAGPTPDPFNAPDALTERLDRIERRLNEIYALLTGQSDPAAEHRRGIVHPDPPAAAQDQPPAPRPNGGAPK